MKQSLLFVSGWLPKVIGTQLRTKVIPQEYSLFYSTIPLTNKLLYMEDAYSMTQIRLVRTNHSPFLPVVGVIAQRHQQQFFIS